jgi:hypothetical protein
MDTVIELKGVAAPKRAEAENEIKEYLAILEKSFSAPEINFSRIIVAHDFEETVNGLLPVLNKEGYNYEAKRHAVKAVGKTIRNMTENGLAFTVVTDGRYIGKWAGNEKPARFEVFFHEFIHAYLDQKRYKSMGAAGFKNDYRTIEGVCFGLALIRDEYIVDSYLDVLCRQWVAAGDGAPAGLNELNLKRGINYPDTFIRLVDGLPDFLKVNIAEFKAGNRGMGELWNGLANYIEEILTVFAHLAGSREKEDDWETVKQKISAPEPYKKYLAGRLKNIYREWINYFLDGYDEAKSLQICAGEIREIFHNCGLSFKNVKDGIFIEVRGK